METKTLDEFPQAAKLSDSDRIVVGQADTSRSTLGEIKKYIQGDLPERIENAKNEAKEYIDQSLSGRNEWLTPVNTASQLQTAGLDNKTNYLCKVVADPAKSGVYQAVAGWEGEPEWELFNSAVDFVNEQELAAGMETHNESDSAHPDIRGGIDQEARNREIAINEHNSSAASHASIRGAIDAEAQARDQQVTDHNLNASAHADIRDIISNHIGLPKWDSKNYIITYTAENGSRFEINLPLKTLSGGMDFDPETSEIILIKQDGTEIRINVADFIDVYKGSIGDHIQVSVEPGNVITATLVSGSIAEAELSAALREKIDGKVGRAPQDGKMYGMKDGEWEEIDVSSVGGGAAVFVSAQIPQDEPSTLLLVMSRTISVSSINGFALAGTTAKVTGTTS